MKISMIGTGYVGLVSGVCFAEMGHNVTCIDVRQEIIDTLNRGESPIYESGLSDLIRRNLKAENVKFETNYSSVKSADAIFLGVGTPSTKTGEANLEYLKDATISVAKEISKDGVVVVIKSTVPIGTHKVIKELVKKHTKHKFYIVNNPEFLKEGSAVDDFLKPDRVIVGCSNEESADIMKELYLPLMTQGHPIHVMSNLSAEMTKYASNSMLATKISFINEIAKLCDLTGADIEEVRTGMASDRRIGPHFIYAGPGYGGSCFPKDVKAIIHTAKQYDMNLQVLNAVEDVNKFQKTYMFEKIKKHFNGDLSGRTFAFWGVAFKPNTDDIRESPAIDMAKALTEQGAKIKIYDQEASDNYLSYMSEKYSQLGKLISKTSNKYDALNDADGLVLMTEWREFRSPDLLEIKQRLREPVIFDTRNILSEKRIADEKIKYYAIGKNKAQG